MKPKEKRTVECPTLEQITAERERLRHQKAYKKALLSTIYSLVVVASIAVLVATLVFPVLQITGTSMEPTLYDEDIIVLVKSNDFQTGDLCAFNYQNKVLIKRVIAKPGDYVEIDEKGNVYVNKKRLNEPYITDKSLGECDIEFPYQVPDHKYFVMGDHRSTSIDSRSSVIGSIDIEQMIGKVFLRIWPIKKISAIG